MRAQADILIYLDSFRNIDVFLQGLYYLQIKLSNDAVPFFMDSYVASKRFHNLYPAQIIDNSYATKIFMLKYSEEIVKLSEVVIFRVEVETITYEEQEPLIIQVDLMFTDLQGDLSPNSVHNYIHSPPAESLFQKVGECTFTVNSLMQGLNQMIFVTYLDTFSSSLMASVHAMTTNYKISDNYIEDFFPDSPDSILEDKIDKVYDTYVLPLALSYNRLIKLLTENIKECISLPLLYNLEGEADYIYKIVYRHFFSLCIKTKEKIVVADGIVKEIQEVAAMLMKLKHEFLENLKKNPEKIMHKLMKEYITLMDDRWGENIIQE